MRRGYQASNSNVGNANKPNYPQNNISYSNQPYYQYAEQTPSNYNPEYTAVTNPQNYASSYAAGTYPSASVSNVTTSQFNAWPYNQGYYYDPNSTYPYAPGPSTMNPNQLRQNAVPYGNQTSRSIPSNSNIQAFKNIIPHQDVHQLLDHKGTKVKVSKIYRIQKTKPEPDIDDSSDDERRRQLLQPPPRQMLYMPPEPAQRIPSAASSCSHCSTCSNCSCTACRHEKDRSFDDNCAACRSEREHPTQNRHNTTTKISKDRK